MEHLTAEQLLDYAEERLAATEARAAGVHLEGCRACRLQLARLQRMTTLLADDRWVTPPASARAAVQQAFREQAVGQSRGMQQAGRTPVQIILSWLRGATRASWQPALALGLLLIVAALLLWQRQEPDVPYTASAASVSGTVESLGTDGQTWQPLTAGAQVQEGDVLSTGADGSMLLTYADGSSTALLANSRLTLARLAGQPRTIRYQMEGGEIFNRVVAHGDANARFEIQTPTATMSSPAGAFRVVVDAVGTTLVRLSSGELTISAAGRSLTLQAGQEAIVLEGQPPRLLTLNPAPAPAP